MAPKPKLLPNQEPGLKVGAPTLGSQAKPVNASFSGPNGGGVLVDVPPQFGLGPAPLISINGVDAPKLGIEIGQSPKSHG